MPEQDTDDDVDYAGPATVLIGDERIAVRVRLEGHTQPMDGRVHWYGRVAPEERLSVLLGGRSVPVTVTTPAGTADGRIGDVDLWGRYRLTGVGNPPYACDEPPTAD